MAGSPDIDIDFADRRKAMAILPCVPAMVLRDEKRTAHPSGVYFQDITVDPFTNLASLDFKTADQVGYFQFDLLNQSVYQEVRDEDHLVSLLNTDPEWSLLEERSYVEQLPQINKHFDVVQSIKPTSILDLAIVLALIRPGKRHLMGRPRALIEQEVWKQDGDDYAFKKAHAISYGALIVVQMNILTARLLAEMENEGSWNILDE